MFCKRYFVVLNAPLRFLIQSSAGALGRVVVAHPRSVVFFRYSGLLYDTSLYEMTMRVKFCLSSDTFQ